MNAIFGTLPIEGITIKEKVLYINEAHRRKYLIMLTCPPLTLSRSISFSDADAAHFRHNDALIVTMLILVDRGSSVNILYGSVLNKMEDTTEIAQAMISPQIQSHLYGDGNETHSLGIIALPVHVDSYNVITKFYMDDMESPHNAILGRSWLHISYPPITS